MALNILESLQGAIGGGIVELLGQRIGEDPAKTQSALDAAFPAILGGLVSKGSSVQGASEIHETIRQGGYGQDTLTGLASAVAGGNATREYQDAGTGLLNGVFGEKMDGIINLVSGKAGIGKTSAASLLGLAAPAVFGVLGREVKARGLNVAGLMGLLSAQMEPLKAHAPAGLGSVLGLLELSDAPGEAKIVHGVEAPKNRYAGWKWAVPAAILGAVLVFMLKTCEMPSSLDTSARQGAQAPDNAAAGSGQPAGQAGFLSLKLPGGVELGVPGSGVERKLVAFIEDKGRPVDKTTWFTFDRLEFETGSAALKPSSMEQLKNVAEILKAYPAVALKIGGYTDNVGNPGANRALSAKRAENTKAELVRLGVAATRLEAEGYGDLHPVADNSTEEGRQRNRRIDLRVTRK